MDSTHTDVGHAREYRRQRRLLNLAALVLVLIIFVELVHPLTVLGGIDWTLAVPVLFFVSLIGVMFGSQVMTGRSPHTVLRPEQIDIRIDDVIGLDPVKEEVIRSINLMLAHKTFAEQMGGTPRRGLLFEGPPGTGKTLTAKAMAAEAGVPFLFATATSFQSSFYGATARKIRSYFKQLRKMAAAEGAAIGYIDEFDAIAGARHGMEMRADTGVSGMVRSAMGTSDLAGPVVNELLVQMQSIDVPLGSARLKGWGIERINTLLPAKRQIRKPSGGAANILVVASTNRADGLDPALLRPGRFDRRLTFDLPDKAGRRAMVDHVLKSKAHDPILDDPERRDALAAVTVGYSPVSIEHLMDEALVNAIRRGSMTMNWADLEHARLATTIGIGQPVAYTTHEKRLISTHEAGHATMAWLVAPERRLEVLTIIKRRDALGMLAHGDVEDVYTRSKSELTALIEVAFGGQVAEELFFGDVSTGPAGDLAYATTVAAQMVGSAGMGGSLISFEAISNGAFGGSNLVGRVLGDPDARERLESLLETCKAHATELLSANRHLVEALRDALLERHELIGSEITGILTEAKREHDDRIIDLREPSPLVTG